MATQHIGKFQEIGLGMESSRGTAETSPDHSIQKLEANFYKTVEKEADESTRAVLADNQKVDKVSEIVDGDISMRLHLDPMGYFFKNIFGNLTTTEETYDDGTSTINLGVYTHEFTVDETITRPSFSVFYAEGDVEDGVIPGCVVDTLTINAPADGLVEAEIELMGKTTESQTFSFSYSDEYDFVGRDAEVRKATDVTGLDTADLLDVKEFDITFDTEAASDYRMDGTYGPADIFQNSQTITGTLVLNFDGEEFKNYYDGNDSFALEIKLESTKNIQDTDEAADDYYPTLKIELPEVYVEDWSRDSGNADVIQQEVSFKASYNSTEETIANATIISDTSEY